LLKKWGPEGPHCITTLPIRLRLWACAGWERPGSSWIQRSLRCSSRFLSRGLFYSRARFLLGSRLTYFFFAAGLRFAAFLAAGFLAAGFFFATFFAAGFLAAGFFFATFFAAGFLAAAFLAAGFFFATFFAAGFLAATFFFAAGFFAAGFFLAIAIVILLHVRISTNYRLRRPDHSDQPCHKAWWTERASHSSARGLMLSAAR